jgi:hypothetical protein
MDTSQLFNGSKLEKKSMDLPNYYALVKIIAEIGAVLGCLSGGAVILASLSVFKYGIIAGFTAAYSGIITIIMSLVGLGLTYCLLASVKAQIDTRNAIIQYLDGKDKT